MREKVRALLAKQEGRVAIIRVMARHGQKHRLVARIHVKEHDPKWSGGDEGALEPTLVETESELEDEIVEILEELEGERDADGWRVYAYNAAAQPVGSKQGAFTHDDDDDDEKEARGAEGRALAAMGTALSTVMGEARQMMKETRLAFGVVCGALASREDVTAKALQGMTEAKIDAITTRAEAEAIEALTQAQAAVEHAINVQPEDAEPNTAADRALAMLERWFEGRFGGALPSGSSSSSSSSSNGDGGIHFDDEELDAMAEAALDDPELQARMGAAVHRARARRAARASEDATSSSSSTSSSTEPPPKKRGKRSTKEPDAPPAPEATP